MKVRKTLYFASAESFLQMDFAGASSNSTFANPPSIMYSRPHAYVTCWMWSGFMCVKVSLQLMSEKSQLEMELRDVSSRMESNRARLVDFHYAAMGMSSDASGHWNDSNVQSSFIQRASKYLLLMLASIIVVPSSSCYYIISP